MTAFVSAADVRGYLNVTSSTDNYSDGNLGSNIRTASEFLQKETHRQFEAQTGATKKFTTFGAASIAIPDLRTVTSATLQGAALTADQSYWLISENNDGIYNTFQLRAYGSDYRGNPQWFDRNLDRYWATGRNTSLPNDLVIVGDWGYLDYPQGLMTATKALSGWLAKHTDALLGGVVFAPNGQAIPYDDMPIEVGMFVNAWRLGSGAVLI